MNLPLRRLPGRFTADSNRVVTRFFIPGSPERLGLLIGQVLALPRETALAALAGVEAGFAGRHRDLDRIFDQHAGRGAAFLADAGLRQAVQGCGDPWRRLVGAYLTMEYAVSAAALFNPSLVRHPDQSGLPPDQMRVVMSLRAVGEGHQSSLVFRAGVLSTDLSIAWDPPASVAVAATAVSDPAYETRLFAQKLAEAGLAEPATMTLLTQLGPTFTRAGLERAIQTPESGLSVRAISSLRWLADSNYEAVFPVETGLGERVLMPLSLNDRNGIEDARFVLVEESEGPIWHATYTAFSGTAVLPQLITTRDFRNFRISTLNGPAAIGKGMALFPRRIDGSWWMLGRQDGRTLTVMRSDLLHFWYEARPLLMPSQPWDLVQVGNCGSPIETPAGWLVLTHGVGPMRRYVISAILLDLADPTRVIGRLHRPLLEPAADERSGYVPNVVYSCGGLVHAGHLVLPYAMSDSMAGLAVLPLPELLNALCAG